MRTNKNAKLSISVRIWYVTGHNRAIGELEIWKTIQDYRGSKGNIHDHTRQFITIPEYTGPYGTKQNYRGPYRTLGNHMGPYRTIGNRTGPYRNIWGNRGLYGTIRGHTGPKGTIQTRGDQMEPEGTICVIMYVPLATFPLCMKIVCTYPLLCVIPCV